MERSEFKLPIIPDADVIQALKAWGVEISPSPSVGSSPVEKVAEVMPQQGQEAGQVTRESTPGTSVVNRGIDLGGKGVRLGKSWH